MENHPRGRHVHCAVALRPYYGPNNASFNALSCATVSINLRNCSTRRGPFKDTMPYVSCEHINTDGDALTKGRLMQQHAGFKCSF